jgi:hypothetical protein
VKFEEEGQPLGCLLLSSVACVTPLRPQHIGCKRRSPTPRSHRRESLVTLGQLIVARFLGDSLSSSYQAEKLSFPGECSSLIDLLNFMLVGAENHGRTQTV